MDVYLVPVGPARHELYCEVEDDAPADGDDDADAPTTHQEAPRGFVARIRASVRRFFARMRQRFRDMLAEAERERRLGRPASAEQSWLGRVKARSMRLVAETIAEQRLLWHLRGETTACLHYPDDLPQPAAMSELRSQLKKDYDKHRFWLTIDSLGFVLSGVFFFVPGPNIIAYYFAFRLVGHFFSLRGAKQGLEGIDWRSEASEPLAELRRLILVDPSAREERVQAVAERLRLEHLASFFARTAVPQERPDPPKDPSS